MFYPFHSTLHKINLFISGNPIVYPPDDQRVTTHQVFAYLQKDPLSKCDAMPTSKWIARLVE